MGAERGRLDERGVSEIYGTLLIISLAFVVTVLLVGFGFLLLDDSLSETENRVAEDTVTEFEQRVSEALEGTGNQSVWEPAPGAEDRYAANESRGKLMVHVETTETYWNATVETDRQGSLVNAPSQESEETRQLGTLAYENDDGSVTAYQGGAVFRRQDQAVTVEEPPSLSISDGQLQLGLVDIQSTAPVSGGELQIQARSLSTNEIEEAIANHIRGPDGDAVAEATVNLTVTSEFAKGWANYAEAELDGVEVYRSSDLAELDENQVKIALGTFGDGIAVENRSESPVIYSGVADHAPQLYNTSAGTLETKTLSSGSGFTVEEPTSDNYTVGIYRASSETNGDREWWTWNRSLAAGGWENVERPKTTVGAYGGFGSGFGGFDIGDDVVTCIVNTSVPDVEFRDFVDEAGEGCLDSPIDVENPDELTAEFQPYLNISEIDVNGPQLIEPGTNTTLDVSVTVENTGPGNAIKEPVALYLSDSRKGGRGKVFVAESRTNLTRSDTATLNETVNPNFLYDPSEGVPEVSFAIGTVTGASDDNRTADRSFRIGDDEPVNITSFGLDDGDITAGEPISGEIGLETNETGEIDTSGVVTAGPNTVGFTTSFTNTTTVDFTLNTDPLEPDFEAVQVSVPGEANATANISVADPRADPEFVVKNVTYDPADRNVSVGEKLRVDVTLKNVGRVRDTQPVQLLSTGGGVLAAKGAVSIDRNEEKTVTLTWTPTRRAANNYPSSRALVLTPTNRSEFTTIAVQDEPADNGDFTLDLQSFDDEVIAGQTITATVNVTNAGSEEVKRMIWMESKNGGPSRIFDRSEQTLAPGSETRLNLTWTTTRADAGDTELAIRTRDDSVDEETTVLRPSDAPDPILLDLDRETQAVTEGETAAFTARVRNPSSSPAAGTVVLETDAGVPVDSVDVTPMQHNELREVTLAWNTVVGDAGSRNVTVSVGSDERTAAIDVKQRNNPRDVAFVHDESRSMVAKEDVNDINSRIGLRLAADVNGINETDFRVSPGEMTVPGSTSTRYPYVTNELRTGMDRVWRAEAANGTVEYFYTGDTVQVGNYERIEILRPDHQFAELKSEPGTTNISAGADELWFEVSSCLFVGCYLDGPVLPNQTASTTQFGFAKFNLTTVGEVTVEDGMPNPAAEFYTADGEAYRHLDALEDEQGSLDTLVETQVTAWHRAPDLPEVVPRAQTWDTFSGLAKLYRTGEEPDDDSVDIYPHGADPFLERHNMTRTLLGELDPTLDRAGYVQFDTFARTQTDISGEFNGTLTDDFAALNETLEEDRGKKADLTAGIETGVDVLTGEDARPIGDPVMVLFSDGIHNYAGKTPREAATEAAEMGVTIHVVALGERAQGSTAQGDRLRAIANRTGGEYVTPGEIDELATRFDRNDSDAATLKKPEFEVEVRTDALGSASLGEEVSVPVEVTNVGNATARQPVWLTDSFEGAVADREQITLGPGDSTERTLTWEARPLAPSFGGGDPPTANGELVARTGTDADTASVTVENDPAEYTIGGLEIVTSEPVLPDKQLTLRSTVENVGGTSGSQRIWLRSHNDVPVASTTVDIAGGGQRETDLLWDLSTANIVSDSITVDVSTDADAQSSKVKIARAAALPEFEVANIRTNADIDDGESVQAGQRLNVTATVTNTGDTKARQYVSLVASDFRPTVVDIVPVELAPDESKDITFSWQTTVADVPEGDALATGSVGIRPESGDGTVSDSVEIRRYDPKVDFDLSIDHKNDPVDAGGDVLEVDVTVENTGSEGDRVLVALRDADDPAKNRYALSLANLGRLNASESVSGTLTYRTEPEDASMDEVVAAVARYNESETTGVTINQSSSGAAIEINRLEPRAQSRPAAITAGEEPLAVKVNLTANPAAVTDSGEAVVSLYRGDAADTEDLLDAHTFTSRESSLLWHPKPGDGDNTAPQKITISVRGDTQTEEVYVNEAPSRLIGSAGGADVDPIRVEVDELDITS
jgi:hypothetical protein